MSKQNSSRAEDSPIVSVQATAAAEEGETPPPGSVVVVSTHSAAPQGERKRGAAPQKRQSKRGKRSGSALPIITAEDIVRDYAVEGFYLGSAGELRCRCSQKACYGDWTKEKLMRHITGSIHKKLMSKEVRIFDSFEEATAAIGPQMEFGLPSRDAMASFQQRVENTDTDEVAAPQPATAPSKTAAPRPPAGPSPLAPVMVQNRAAMFPLSAQASPMLDLKFEPQPGVLWTRVELPPKDDEPATKYWYNASTGETAWVPPPPPVPKFDDADTPDEDEVRTRNATKLARSTHKKLLTPDQILRRYPHDAFFKLTTSDGTETLHCLCSRHSLGPWDNDMVKRHIACAAHAKVQRQVVTIPVANNQAVTIYASSLVRKHRNVHAL